MAKNAPRNLTRQSGSTRPRQDHSRLHGTQNFEVLTSSLRLEYPNWWTKFSVGEPIYCLPIEVINALSRTFNPPPGGEHYRKNRLISEEDQNAEIALRQICMRYASAVGLGRTASGLVCCPGLLESDEYERRKTSFLAAVREQFPEWGSEGPNGEDAEALFHKLLDRSAGAESQLLGIAGVFILNPTFREERKRLFDQWKTLEVPLPLDLDSSVLFDESRWSEGLARRIIGFTLTDPIIHFYKAYSDFLKRYDLTHLVTWDLPMPAGPLEHVPAGLVTRVRGNDAIVSAIPASFEIPSTPNMHSQIREIQKQEGLRRGIDPKELAFPIGGASPRAGHPSNPETTFRMWLIELAVLRRYGRPYRLAARLIEAFAEMFGIEVASARKIREGYKKFLVADAALYK